MAPKVSPLSHRRVDLVPERAGLVQDVAPDSLAADLGIRSGDRIVSLHGKPLVDVLDFQYAITGDAVEFTVARGAATEAIEVEVEGEESWGITFADATFDGVHICENTCPFCFIKQIPKGMRKSLYVMDDDYRHSMLYGTFVTLTNLTEEDWQRIEEQKLGPLHVSVHSTNPKLRSALVGNPKGAQIMEHLGRLDRAGIEFHAQLVLCPGINDGDEMDRSLEDLSSFEHLKSIAGVPVGLTRFGLERQSMQLRQSRKCMRNLPGTELRVRRYETAEAEAVVRHAERWQERFLEEMGHTFFFLGDEFYLMIGEPVPTAEHYDGFPQIEDGIGITRHLLDDLAETLDRTPTGALAGSRGTVACGTLIGPTIRAAVDSLCRHTQADLDVVVVENGFFGPEINVSGLLTGDDVGSRLEGRTQALGPVYISQRMLSDRTGTLLDDMTIEELSNRVGSDVVPALTFQHVVADLQERSLVSRAA